VAYSTSDLNTIIRTLEGALTTGVAEISHEGKLMRFRSVDEIRKAITYFTSLMDEATDAPSDPAPKVRTYYLYGGKGIGI
jgi:hypothetical protein